MNDHIEEIYKKQGNEAIHGPHNIEDDNLCLHKTNQHLEDAHEKQVIVSHVLNFAISNNAPVRDETSNVTLNVNEDNQFHIKTNKRIEEENEKPGNDAISGTQSIKDDNLFPN